MDFSLLGPLEVVSDSGQPVPVPQRLHRVILSVLLLYAGTPCSHGKLTDALWGAGKLPRKPVTAIRSHICRIRRDLSLDQRLRTLPGAYRMDPAPGELDLQRFAQLRSQARHAVAQGDLEQGAALLSAALECWRDPSFTDLPSTPTIDADVTHLREQRRDDETLLMDLLLALGRHHDVVPGLYRMVAADPLHERSWAQLMVALYKSGRRNEALAAYSRARAFMITRLGTEPARVLQELLAQILADTEDLTVMTSGGEPALRRDGGPPDPLVTRHR